MSNRYPLALHGHSHLGSRFFFFRWLSLNSILQPLGWFPLAKLCQESLATDLPGTCVCPLFWCLNPAKQEFFPIKNKCNLGSGYIYWVYKQIPLIYHFESLEDEYLVSIFHLEHLLVRNIGPLTPRRFSL